MVYTVTINWNRNIFRETNKEFFNPDFAVDWNKRILTNLYVLVIQYGTLVKLKVAGKFEKFILPTFLTLFQQTLKFA